MIDEASTYLEDETLLADSIPTASDTAPDVAFTEDETYDCGDTAEATVSDFTATELMATCADYSLTQDHIQCQDVTDIL